MLSMVHKWYNGCSKHFRDSVIIAITVVGAISTILSIIGISLGDWKESNWITRSLVVIIIFAIILVLVYFVIGRIFKKSVNLIIGQTPVSIEAGNIFEAKGLRVIGCDTHFDTRVDDIVIAKNSLHGQLFLQHGELKEIQSAIKAEAKRLNLSENTEGLYDFPLGTIICYNSNIDKCTYLMLASAELNNDHEAHTNMVKFEYMLMKMWKEINRVYANRDICLPLLGTGILRFDDGPKEKEDLLRCILCTLHTSRVCFNSKIKILVYSKIEDIPLYEYKDVFHKIPRR